MKTPIPTFNRRRFVQGAAALGAGWRVAAPSPVVAQDDAARTLRLVCWVGYDDPELTRAFREQTGFTIESNYLGANDEIFLNLRSGGIGTVDLVTPESGVVKSLVDVDLIQPLDYGRLANAVGYLPRFQQPEWAKVDGVMYAAPFLWGAAPLVYNADALPEPPERWLDLLSSKYRGKIAMHDDGLGHFRVWNRALGAADPMRVTPEQLDRATELLMALKSDQAVAFTGNMMDIAGLLARGEVWLTTVGWEAVPRMLAAAEANLKLAYPAPGSFTFCDSYCIARDAPNLDAAYAYIDSLLSPPVQATAMHLMTRGTVNANAIPLLSEEIRALYPYDDLDPFFELNPLLGFPPLQSEDGAIATYTDWVKAWERVRFAALSEAAGA